MVLGPLDDWLIAASLPNIEVLCGTLLRSYASQHPTIRSISPSVPRVEIDPFDTVPFSESFSDLLHLDRSLDLQETCEPEVTIDEPASTLVDSMIGSDLSYNIEHYTNIRDLVPEWEDDEVEEIMVISRKTKLPTILETSEVGCASEVITLSELDLLYNLNEGTVNSEASLCRNRITNALHIVKTVTLSADEYALEDSISKLVNKLDCPFLAKTYLHFWNAAHMNLIMDFYPGGDLLTHIIEHGPFQPDLALFYASEIVQGIGTLHDAGVLHCALRAENIMIDAHGHIVLTDFSCARRIGSSGGQCHRDDGGEFEDLGVSPGWGDEFAVDYWSLGVLLHLLLFGTPPFSNRLLPEDVYSLQNEITYHSTPVYHREGVHLAAQDLITQCLERNPMVRLNIEQIKAHNYFSSVDWRCVATRDTIAPYVPEQVQEDTDLGRKFTDEGTEPTLLVSDAVSGVLLFQTVEAHKDYPVIREPSTEAKSVQTSLNTGHLQISSEEPSKSAVPMSQDPHQNPVEPILSSEPLEDQMVRILTAKERQALFWESLDCDIGPSTSPRVHHPQKLRKRRSDPSRRIFSNMILSAMRRPVNFGKKARKVTPVPDTPTQSLYPLDLLNGIEKIGNGIGFTYSQPLAARSKASICTTTPRSCYGIFSNRFSAPIFRPIKRKVKSCLDQGSGGMETNEEREQMAVTREVHESVWNLGASPVFLSSPTERTVVNSPASDAGLLTPSTVLFKDANTKEIKAGDLDATLRLVSPPSFSPMSGCRPVDFHRFERPFEAC